MKINILTVSRGLGYSGSMFNVRDKMKKELLSKIKKARYCFGWVNIYVEDGAYLQVTKETLRYIVKNAPEEALKIMLKGDHSTNPSFTLRDDGDLYIN